MSFWELQEVLELLQIEEEDYSSLAVHDKG